MTLAHSSAGLGCDELHSFTKPPLLQESRLTGGGSPNLGDHVEFDGPVEWKVGASRLYNCAAVAPIFHCAGLYTIQVHRLWESRHISAF